MDLRVEKTIKSIFNAFLELRAKNPLEKISVTELSERATINKATFYLHFKDIYDLSDTLESELVNSIIDKITPEEFEREPIAAIDALTEAYASKKHMISILFADTRSQRLAHKVEQGVKELLFSQNPEWKEDVRVNALISYAVFGSYYAFVNNDKFPPADTIRAVGRVNEQLKTLL
ncbi:MAG: TetR/AcrR family transcriptional regulator [Bacillota bacterium]|nr:MAG: TetR/AcrR family transcriptional regulator [Bacillota bacterium]